MLRYVLDTVCISIRLPAPRLFACLINNLLFAKKIPSSMHVWEYSRRYSALDKEKLGKAVLQ